MFPFRKSSSKNHPSYFLDMNTSLFTLRAQKKQLMPMTFKFSKMNNVSGTLNQMALFCMKLSSPPAPIGWERRMLVMELQLLVTIPITK